jgi:hypothetical protein
LKPQSLINLCQAVRHVRYDIKLDHGFELLATLDVCESIIVESESQQRKCDVEAGEGRGSLQWRPTMLTGQ